MNKVLVSVGLRHSAIFRILEVFFGLAFFMISDASATWEWTKDIPWPQMAHHWSGHLSPPVPEVPVIKEVPAISANILLFFKNYLEANNEEEALSLIHGLDEAELREAILLFQHRDPSNPQDHRLIQGSSPVASTLMTHAAFLGWRKAVERLINCPSYSGEDSERLGTTALHEAAKGFHWELISLFPQTDYDLFEIDHLGRIPLIAAVGTQGYKSAQVRLARYDIQDRNKYETVRILLERMGRYPANVQKPEIAAELFHIVRLAGIEAVHPEIYQAVTEKISIWNLDKKATKVLRFGKMVEIFHFNDALQFFSNR